MRLTWTATSTVRASAGPATVRVEVSPSASGTTGTSSEPVEAETRPVLSHVATTGSGWVKVCVAAEAGEPRRHES